MTYQVQFHPQARKFLSKCNIVTRKRIERKLRLIKENPFNYLEHYEGKNYYKLRIGTYRAIIEVDFSERILYVLIIGHRSWIYKRVRFKFS